MLRLIICLLPLLGFIACSSGSDETKMASLRESLQEMKTMHQGMETKHDSMETAHETWMKEHQAAFRGPDDSLLVAIRDEHQKLMEKHQAIIEDHAAIIKKDEDFLNDPNLKSIPEKQVDDEIALMKTEITRMKEEHDQMDAEHEAMQQEHQLILDDRAAKK